MPTYIPDLLKTDGAKTSHVHVDDYYTPGDGGGGDFEFFAKDTTPEDNGLVFTPDPTVNPPLPPGRWKRIWSNALNARWFGAQGDGGTDDYDALRAAAAAVNAGKSKILHYPKGTYYIGRVKLICSPTLPPKNDDIVFENCDGLHLIGHDSIIDVNGDFIRADVGIKSVQPFVFMNCKNVTMEGFELNGNVDNMSRADKNFTQGGSGIVFGGGSKHYTLENINAHHFPTDGIYLGLSNPHATKTNPGSCDQFATLSRVTARFNARNGLSCISLTHGKFTDCDFSENGRAAGSYGPDAPALGIDVEPSFYTSETPGDLVFENCRCINNGSGAISITAPNCKFSNCVFWGTGYYSVWSAQANHVFEGCLIYGECTNRYDPNAGQDPTKPLSSANPAYPQFSTVYRGCHFEDKEFGRNKMVYRTAAPYGACVSSNYANVTLSGCTVIGNKTRGVQLGAPSDISKPHSLTECQITHRMESLVTMARDPGHCHQSQLNYAVVDHVHFKEQFIDNCKPPNGPRWDVDVRNLTELSPLVIDGPCVVRK